MVVLDEDFFLLESRTWYSKVQKKGVNPDKSDLKWIATKTTHTLNSYISIPDTLKYSDS